MPNNNLIDKKQLCQRLGLGKTTIERYQKNGSIPYIKCGTIPRSTVLYDYDKVVEALNQMRYAAPPETKAVPVESVTVSPLCRVTGVDTTTK